jgi:hypothetical protein
MPSGVSHGSRAGPAPVAPRSSSAFVKSGKVPENGHCPASSKAAAKRMGSSGAQLSVMAAAGAQRRPRPGAGRTSGSTNLVTPTIWLWPLSKAA